MLKIVAKRYVREGFFDTYVALAQRLVDQSRQEIGCIEYALYADRRENLAVIMETWESEAYLAAHLQLVRSEGWPDKLNAFADPERPAQAERYAYVY